MTFENNQFLNNILEFLTNIITIESFAKLAVLYFFIIWISIIVWVIRDISNRTDSIILEFISLLIVLIWTPLWIFIYLLIRPTKTLFEKYYDEIEGNLDFLTQSIKDKFQEKEKHSISCDECNYPIEKWFNFCPNCNIELKYSCRFCKKKINKSWKVCAHCWKNEPYKEAKSEKKDKKKK